MSKYKFSNSGINKFARKPDTANNKAKICFNEYGLKPNFLYKNAIRKNIETETEIKDANAAPFKPQILIKIILLITVKIKVSIII